MKAIIDFKTDWKTHMLSDLKNQGYQVFSSDSEESISHRFFNVRRRRISVRPRLVYESSELSCPKGLEAGYENLKLKMLSGDDVTPHQSRNLLDVDYNDTLLNDWGFQHFHLGVNAGPSQYVERTGPLLFALVKEDAVYCIAVLPHGAWSEQELVKIAHRNWPAAIAQFKLDGAIGLSQQYTNNDIAALRKAGVQTLVEVEANAVYAPIGGGYSTARTSIAVTVQSDRYRALIDALQAHVIGNMQTFMQIIAKKGLAPACPPNFSLVVNQEGYFAVETGSSVRFLLHKHTG